MILGLFRRILDLAGPYKRRIQGACVCAVLEAILSKLPIMFAFLVLDSFYKQTLLPIHCLYVGIGLLIIISLQATVRYLSNRLQSAAGYMIFTEKRMQMGEHLRKLPMGYFTEGNIGKISSVLSTDIVYIEETAMDAISNIVSYILAAAVLIIFLFTLNPWLGAAALIISLFAVLAGNRMNRYSLIEASERQEQSEKLTDAVLSFTEGIGVIKSYNLLGEKSKDLTDNFRASRDTAIGFEKRITPWISGLNVIYSMGTVILLSLSIWMWSRGALTVSYLLGMLLFVFDLFGPLKSLYGESARLTVMNSCLNRIEEVLNERVLVDTGKEIIPDASPSIPEISFEHVSFAYQDKEVLHDISFELPTNSMLALAGPSGGGKTTIASLIARFWDVQSGTIRIRGKDIKMVSVSNLMDHISMVFQNVYLFQDTIYNNISMGKPEASEEEVHDAAKKARCYDFIMDLPDGFQTMVGEGGATLSGGEKQRISIARCILKDAPIVILDEATASVDTDNESYIQEAVSELVKGKTLMVIAHRLNTIREADQILVISDGRIIQEGTHNELVKQSGTYQDFISILENNAGWSMSNL